MPQLVYLRLRFSKKAKKFDEISILVLTILSNVKTLRMIAPNFCGILRKAELYLHSAINNKIFELLAKSNVIRISVV